MARSTAWPSLSSTEAILVGGGGGGGGEDEDEGEGGAGGGGPGSVMRSSERMSAGEERTVSSNARS